MRGVQRTGAGGGDKASSDPVAAIGLLFWSSCV